MESVSFSYKSIRWVDEVNSRETSYTTYFLHDYGDEKKLLSLGSLSSPVAPLPFHTSNRGMNGSSAIGPPIKTGVFDTKTGQPIQIENKSQVSSQLNAYEHGDTKNTGQNSISGPVVTRGTNLHRRAENIGEYSVLKVPMQKKTVIKIAEKAGIGLEGIKIKIRRDPEMLNPNFPFVGNTPNTKTIELYPKAFTDKDELIKTLGHERIHIYQRKVFGEPDSTQLLHMEKAAQKSEESWICYARMKGIK
jgi:hypothetical protein